MEAPSQQNGALLSGLEEEGGAHTALIEALLNVVSRAHALCAELQRLSRRVSPLLFTSDFYDKYKDVLFDFEYLKAPEHFEDQVERSLELLELSDSLRDDHLPVMKRYFSLFEHLVLYHQDLIQIAQDLDRGVYIQSTLEGLLQDKEGKQLILEALGMLGVLLLMLDKEIPSRQRQVVIVCMYRYVGTADIPNFEQICSLCADTSFKWHQTLSHQNDQQQSQAERESRLMKVHKFPREYPSKYFLRLAIPTSLVSKIVTRLLSEDFYNQLVYFSLNDSNANHRSRALASQASLLFVLLYFHEEILEKEFSIMRELSDKHYADNWVVVIYPGFSLDVCSCWDHYKAAKAALTSVVTTECVKECTQRHVACLRQSRESIEGILHDGVLHDDSYMERHASKQVLGVVLSCNVALRWLLLNCFSPHAHMKTVRQVLGAKGKKIDEDFCDEIVDCLMGLVVVEKELQICLKKLVDEKVERWQQCQQEVVAALQDLAEFYSGSHALKRFSINVKDENLHKYFLQMSRHVEKLDINKPTASGRKIQQLISALHDVEEFHQLQHSLQTKEYLSRVRTMLVRLTNIASISEHDINVLEVAADMGWAFGEILSHHLLPRLHFLIEGEPMSTLRLRWLFVKLRSVLDVPLMRPSQANSQDMRSISEYWSSELVKFVAAVTSCIPRSMFNQLDEIFSLQTHKLRELPTKLEKTKLRYYVQSQDRADLARVTFSISMLTEGMLRIETTRIGVEVVEPKHLLEMGVRKQLTTRMVSVLQRTLSSSSSASSSSSSTKKASKMSSWSLGFGSSASSKAGESSAYRTALEDKLLQTCKHLQGIKRSLEYIQDYMQVHGIAIWQEEMCKLVSVLLERELGRRKLVTNKSKSNKSNTFTRPLPSTEADEETTYLLEAIEYELRRSSHLGGSKVKQQQQQTFLGYLYDELTELTSPFENIYSFAHCGWFDSATGSEKVGLNTFELLRGAVAVSGTTALDQIVQLETYQAIRDTSAYLNKVLQNVLRDEVCQVRSMMLAKDGLWAEELDKILLSLSKSHAVKPLYREKFPRIGQGQLIRRHFAIELSSNAKLESSTYIRSLQCLNRSLIRHEKQKLSQGQSQGDESGKEGGEDPIESKLLEKLSRHLEYSGLHDPLQKVYHTFLEAKDDDSIPVTLLILSLLFMRDYSYQRQNNSVPVVTVKKNKHTPDFTVTTVGFETILQQLPLSLRMEFLELLQFVYKTKLKQACDTKQLEDSTKLGNEVLVMNQFIKLLVQLIDVEGYALPKLLDDTTLDIDVELVSA